MIYIYTYVYIYVCIYIYVYVYTYIYIYIYNIYILEHRQNAHEDENRAQPLIYQPFYISI